MKTAICISGIPRFWSQFPLNIFDGDYFMHCWDMEHYHSDGCFTKFPSDFTEQWRSQDDLVEYFRPKEIVMEPFSLEVATYFDNLSKKHIDGHRRKSVYSMYYSIMKTIEMVPDEYTHIIRCRFDTRVSDKIIPEDGFWIPKNDDFYGINDQFAYGDSGVMRYYANTYLSIPTQVELNPEKILKHHMQNIKINRIEQKVWLARDYN